jgi:hypothetical protein
MSSPSVSRAGKALVRARARARELHAAVAAGARRRRRRGARAAARRGGTFQPFLNAQLTLAALAPRLRAPQCDRFIPTRSAMDLDAARYSFAENPAAAGDSSKEIMSPSKVRAANGRLAHCNGRQAGGAPHPRRICPRRGSSRPRRRA